MIADNRTADEDDLGFELPVSAAMEEPVLESDVPVLNDEPESDIPFDDVPPAGDE